MDYKEKYEQALERAKYYHDRDNIQFLENIFPELKESDYERIRKQTLKVLNYYKDEEKSEGRMPIEIEECIAWLEKQGEQKPVEWSQVDLISLCYLADFVDKNGDAFYGKNKPNVVKWVRSFAELPTHEHINDIEQKSYWSEEDEQTFIKSVEALEDFGKFELADWLKEHKNQFQTPQSQWKPSEEQIEALDFAVDCIVPDEFCFKRKELKGLLEQLKKLMEE